jgi:cytochrome c5
LVNKPQEAVMQSQVRSSVRARALPPAIAIFAMLMAFSGPADAQRKDRDGKEVVDAVCVACHGSGKDNAPRIGDAKAWAPRAAQGLTALTSHAITGIRKMPAHGGSTGVSDLELQRAITYMVNQSGGHWVEPMAAATPAMARSTETLVQTQCATCHKEGKDGAPKIGDRAAWTQRLSKGLDPLVASAVHGHGPMPARGGMPDLSDLEIRSAILYMFNYGMPPPPPAAAAPAPNDPHHKVVAGTDIYLGMMRADAVKGAAAPPTGKGYYHLNVSLADNKTQAPVKDAQVVMRVTDGMTMQTRTLAPVVANNAVSYGDYFRFDSGSAYNIVVEIKRPNLKGTIEAKFEFKAP